MKSKKAKKAKKQVQATKGQQILSLIITIFICLFLLGVCIGGGNDNKKDDESTPSETKQEVVDEKEEKKEETDEERFTRYIENFIDTYNANCATEPLVFVEDYELKDKESGHYRTEYRLPSFQDDFGAFCTIGDSTSMEILGYRVYIEGDTPTVAQASLDILKLFYPDISDESLAELAETMSDPEEMSFTNSHVPSISGSYYFDINPNTSSVMISGGIPLNE